MKTLRGATKIVYDSLFLRFFFFHLWILNVPEMITLFPLFKLFSLIWMTRPILCLASCLSGYLFVSLLKLDPKQNSPVGSARRFPVSLPCLFMPHLLITYLIWCCFLTGLWRSRLCSTNPAFLTTRLRSLHCFMNACCWLTSAWHPHGICSFSSHQEDILFTQGFAS